MSGPGAGSGDLLDPLEKREVLYSEETPREELIAWGEAFLEAGHRMDALDFFTQARSEEKLRDFARQAREQGDTFVFDRCALALGRKVEREEWLALAERARSGGKEAFAALAEIRAGTRHHEGDLLEQDEAT